MVPFPVKLLKWLAVAGMVTSAWGLFAQAMHYLELQNQLRAMGAAGQQFRWSQFISPLTNAVTPFMASAVLYVACELTAFMMTRGRHPDDE